MSSLACRPFEYVPCALMTQLADQVGNHCGHTSQPIITWRHPNVDDPLPDAHKGKVTPHVGFTNVCALQGALSYCYWVKTWFSPLCVSNDLWINTSSGQHEYDIQAFRHKLLSFAIARRGAWRAWWGLLSSKDWDNSFWSLSTDPLDGAEYDPEHPGAYGAPTEVAAQEASEEENPLR